MHGAFEAIQYLRYAKAPLEPDIIVNVKSVTESLRFVVIGATAALLGLVACASQPKPAARASAAASVKDVSQRKHAPDFELKDASGKVVHLTDYKGKVVLLDFWATWCGPCAIEIPWFMEFERKYKDQGFEVLGVSMDDDGWKAINPYVTKRKINYRVILGDDKTGDQYGGLEALPTTFVIDRAGRIAATHVGLTDKRVFQDAIEKLLEDSAVPAGGQSASADGAKPDSSAGLHG